MNTTEIMINDLFYVEDGDEKRVVKITSIDSPVESVRGIYLDNGEDTGWFIVDLLMPIRITIKIMRSNAFVLDGKLQTWYRRDNDLLIEKDIHKYLAFDRHIELVHVHELQRALRCCGLFDLANNFKMN